MLTIEQLESRDLCSLTPLFGSPQAAVGGLVGLSVDSGGGLYLQHYSLQPTDAFHEMLTPQAQAAAPPAVAAQLASEKFSMVLPDWSEKVADSFDAAKLSPTPAAIDVVYQSGTLVYDAKSIDGGLSFATTEVMDLAASMPPAPAVPLPVQNVAGADYYTGPAATTSGVPAGESTPPVPVIVAAVDTPAGVVAGEATLQGDVWVSFALPVPDAVKHPAGWVDVASY